MVAQPGIAMHDTFLAPGQRYVAVDRPAWRADQHLTILRIDREPDGSTRVTFACPGGREVNGAANRLESAVLDGLIVPVVGSGRIAAC